LIDLLGYAAGFLTTFALVPQIVRVYQLKSAHEISILFNTSMLLGIFAWLAYGIILGLVPLIVWNSIGASFTALLLISKVKYGK
jgi:MtN3 and saliva related transmembrane protein